MCNLSSDKAKEHYVKMVDEIDPEWRKSEKDEGAVNNEFCVVCDY